MDPVAVGFDPDFSLDDLTRSIQEREAALGPITGLYHDDDETVGLFEISPTVPSPPVELRLLVGGTAVLPPGATEICRGTVYLSGSLIGVVAYRQAD